ncbi:shikimate 5-dehydrogenase [Sulfolobales archaeon HS-7]|nr:shikimate 5-dehydrogenase [Sulfolobales archaeon HS-7]
MFNINAETRLYCLVGNGIKYSLSPTIHNYSFRELMLNAVYLAFDIDPSNFHTVFPALLSISDGINVTIPYKEEVLRYVKHLSTEAERIGAVNTVHNGTGYNTDYIAVKQLIPKKLGGNCLVFGAGGAGKTITVALAESGCDVILVNRNYDRAKSFADKEVRMGLNVISFPSYRGDYCEKTYSVLANALPAEATIPCIPNGDIAIDFSYAKESRFSKTVKERGIKLIDGITILIKQALESQKIWLGKSVNEDKVRRVLDAR